MHAFDEGRVLRGQLGACLHVKLMKASTIFRFLEVVSTATRLLPRRKQKNMPRSKHLHFPGQHIAMFDEMSLISFCRVFFYFVFLQLSCDSCTLCDLLPGDYEDVARHVQRDCTLLDALNGTDTKNAANASPERTSSTAWCDNEAPRCVLPLASGDAVGDPTRIIRIEGDDRCSLPGGRAYAQSFVPACSTPHFYLRRSCFATNERKGCRKWSWFSLSSSEAEQLP
ncbi:hypothetical protein N658DRAFT_232103 [Parathielavia hyrcaniae]|uniref:Uncharacterized protein n=1 Tax=Parathielavia hyrcaniae TaxID=113614 RepID=A0AAN6Q597_9PEZI|nr:hypothetical protein N658DRAFT_232103 [Parathielavia hyrcaniae]